MTIHRRGDRPRLLHKERELLIGHAPGAEKVSGQHLYLGSLFDAIEHIATIIALLDHDVHIIAALVERKIRNVTQHATIWNQAYIFIEQACGTGKKRLAQLG